MTLGEFFEATSANPKLVLYYSLAIPVIAGVISIVAGEEGKLSPWKYFYSALIFLVSIPGIFAVFLNLYLFLFEKSSIMDTNIYTQILPVVIMFLTFFIIRIKTSFSDIPGFEKISGLIMIISVIMLLMWIADRTHIFAISITRLPIQYIFLIFIGLYLFFRYALKNLVK